MDGLKQVALIKSAKFDFASVDVDGNSLFIGVNSVMPKNIENLIKIINKNQKVLEQEYFI